MEQKQSRAQLWEDNYPSILSIAITLISLTALWRDRSWIHPVVDGIAKLAPSALNISAIAMGFLATAQAILLTLNDSRALVALRHSGHYPRLVRFFTRALAISFAYALISALLTAIRLNLGGVLRYTSAAVWVFSGFVALFCYYRASRLLSEILRINGASEGRGQDESSAEKSDNRESDIEILEG